MRRAEREGGAGGMGSDGANRSRPTPTGRPPTRERSENAMLRPRTSVTTAQRTSATPEPLTRWRMIATASSSDSAVGALPSIVVAVKVMDVPP